MAEKRRARYAFYPITCARALLAEGSHDARSCVYFFVQFFNNASGAGYQKVYAGWHCSTNRS